MCSHASLGHYKDQIFIVVLSETFNFVSIGKWDRVEAQFQVFQSLRLGSPSDAIFFNHEDFLYLSITTGTSKHTEIRRFMYRGAMAFTEEQDMNVKLVGIQSHNIISHPLLETPLVSSTGEH